MLHPHNPKLNKTKHRNHNNTKRISQSLRTAAALLFPELFHISGQQMPAVRFITLLLLSLSLSPLSLSLSENEALLLLKKSFTHSGSLDSWVSSTSPCKDRWQGVICFNGIITGLHLTNMGISGSVNIDALYEIKGVRTISLINNSFTGTIPDFNRLGAVKALYISGNDFSGEISSDYFSRMSSLKKVWLSDNKFSGKIPESLMDLSNIIELHLENNQFSGPIPAFEQNTLKSLDLSNNRLEGEIPSTLSKFNETSFQGNEGLCGTLLNKECTTVTNNSPASPEAQKKSSPKLAIIMMIVIVMILLLVLTSILSARRREENFDMLGKENLDEVNVEVQVSNLNSSRRAMESIRKGTSSKRGSSHGSRSMMGDLVMVNEENGAFGLPDLMKAAAEVLGNGALGSAYKAVLGNGFSVVVKRMREMNRLGRDGFDAEIRMLGRLRHRNVLTPLAYHYRKEEKLVVSAYVPKGSLLYALHGDRGVCHSELNWPTRLKIIQGVARGLGFLHSEFATSDLPHGNLKSSNVLLGTNYEPLVADYAFYPLINNNQASQALFAYKSPEYIQNEQISPKSDVYCLGIIILEILTGKFPSQYLSTGKGGTDVVQWVRSAISEKREAELIDPEIVTSTDSVAQMEQLLQIGSACTESNPEQRLDMKEAIRRIEEVQI